MRPRSSYSSYQSSSYQNQKSSKGVTCQKKQNNSDLIEEEDVVVQNENQTVAVNNKYKNVKSRHFQMWHVDDGANSKHNDKLNDQNH